MLACNVLLPGGVNGDCQIPLSEVKNILICDKDVKFSYTAKNTLANWTTLINNSSTGLTIYANIALDSYNNTTDDPNIVTGAVSKTKKITNVPLPSYEFFLETGMCDFKEILNTLQGGIYGIFYELQDGTILGTMDTSGTEVGYFKPFKCRLNAASKLLQEVDATNAFKLYVFHTNKQQLFDQFIFEPAWDTAELVDAMPIGLNMVKTSIIVAATAVQAVQINVRCGDGKTGLVAGDFEFSTTMSNVLTPNAGTFTEVGGGAYTIAIEKATSTLIGTGDIVYMRVKLVATTTVTYLSNWIKIEGITP